VPHWPVFNLADSAIVCGGVLMVLIAARGYRIDGKVQATEPRPGPEQPRPGPEQPRREPPGPARKQEHPSGGGRG
jgi:signal peptidase II